MIKSLSKIFSNPYLLIIITVIVKIPLFFTKHIQEDSFITWRVARNLLDYGVIGFNGGERISASTTHFYVIISALFQLIFGDGFIRPILIFSCVVFAIGSWWLGKILFRKDVLKRGFFVIFLNMTPPALAASCLGMEYGILFFLYSALIYFGIYKRKNWAYIVFPVLLLWTRIDAVIFLGVFFLADLIIRKKINFVFIFGGILGVVSVVLFNEFYFGELVNHTITAKKIAYKNLTQNNSIEFLLYQWAYYGGLIKKYSLFTFLAFIGFLIFLGFCVSKIIKDETRISSKTKTILLSVLAFALLKITVFAYFKAYFDWYYWLPRVFLFVGVLYYLLNYVPLRNRILIPGIFIVFFGLYVFQILQSYTIGYMEETQRMQIAKDIERGNTELSQSILLEPAGKIPFYTGLYTYDEVGLVNKKITDEMLKDEKFWWMNSVRDYKPDYILTIIYTPGDERSYYKMKQEDKAYFDSEYVFVKGYPIAEIHQNAPEILRRIYGIRPIGKDYYLYKKVK
ncbi:MAG: hypothetical protein L6264_13065 [Weeksellaceae bacterium]|nr:hypothetical protein [Bacteroidota bacterium]MCG2781868.1 hypothetical protein [Weeksellaceae bacterium]